MKTHRLRMFRVGGAWNSIRSFLCEPYRSWDGSPSRNDYLGFRLVRKG